MLRTFEYDDYPWSKERFLRVADHLKRQFPRFKCSVFAIPGCITKRDWVGLQKRSDFIEVCPHGFSHQKRECRDKQMYENRVGLLDYLADDDRYQKVFKAPWHGIDGGFLELLRERDFAFCFAHLGWRFPYPTTEQLAWSPKDARAACGVEPESSVHVEAHSLVWPPRSYYARRNQQIDSRNMRRLMRYWHEDDEWEFVSRLLRPCLRKVQLGGGPHVFEGWDNLDNRTQIDKRIIHWEAPAPLPYTADRVDILFTSHFWNYLDDDWYRPMAREMFRVLRPGGIARLSEDATDRGYIWRRPGQSSRGTGTVRSLPTKTKIRFALRRAGFRVYPVGPGRTRSPHTDVLQGDSRHKKWEAGFKFYIEAVKP